MCLAQGHYAVMPVRLEPTAPQSRVKHSTIEPLAPCLIIFVFTNSVDPDEMPHYAAFHLGLHCLSKYVLGVTCIERVNKHMFKQNERFSCL